MPYLGKFEKVKGERLKGIGTKVPRTLGAGLRDCGGRIGG